MRGRDYSSPCIFMHRHKSGFRHAACRPAEAILGPLADGLCRTLQTDFGEHPSLLKNSLYTRFGPRSSPKHTVCGAIWSLWSPIRSHCELSADFFNRLTPLYSIT